jgi:hypothetical protein
MVAGGGMPACATLERASLGSHRRRASRSESRCRCTSGSRNCCAFGSRSRRRHAAGEPLPLCHRMREPLSQWLRIGEPPLCHRMREPLSLWLQIGEPPPSCLRIRKSPPPQLRIWDRPIGCVTGGRHRLTLSWNHHCRACLGGRPTLVHRGGASKN